MYKDNEAVCRKNKKYYKKNNKNWKNAKFIVVTTENEFR